MHFNQILNNDESQLQVNKINERKLEILDGLIKHIPNNEGFEHLPEDYIHISRMGDEPFNDVEIYAFSQRISDIKTTGNNEIIKSGSLEEDISDIEERYYVGGAFDHLRCHHMKRHDEIERAYKNSFIDNNDDAMPFYDFYEEKTNEFILLESKNTGRDFKEIRNEIFDNSPAAFHGNSPIELTERLGLFIKEESIKSFDTTEREGVKYLYHGNTPELEAGY